LRIRRDEQVVVEQRPAERIRERAALLPVLTRELAPTRQPLDPRAMGDREIIQQALLAPGGRFGPDGGGYTGSRAKGGERG